MASLNDGETVDYDKMVQKAYDKLLYDYLNSNHRKRTEVINKAFNLARSAHEGAKRKSGEPYILHPIAVADICCNEIGLGSTSIASALLHDVVEDTDYTVQDIEDMFGESIARIVNGLTKLSGEILVEVVEKKVNASAQLENIRRLLLTANDDIRIIIIKIADRLHNMRTLESMPETKQAKIAAETRLFYSPLAERLGMYKIKSELQDLSLKYDYPQQYEDIVQKIQESSIKRSTLFSQFYDAIRDNLKKTGLHYEIQHRVKGVYSIWNKMQQKQLSFNEIYDIYAIRIIFKPSTPESEYSDCFKIYRAISSKFRVKDDRTRDWLTTPKENGYQALHITVMGPMGEWVEVQIRSNRMHAMAERGLAAHWIYKQKPGIVDDLEQTILNNVRALISNPGPKSSDDYETIMYKFANQDIIIFTQEGKQQRIPQDFTVLDYAYTVDRKIGDHCLGAKVNHVMVDIDHNLQNGDQVEILTASKTHPKEEWLNYVTSPLAKRAIKDYLSSTKSQDTQKGKFELEAFLHDQGYALQDLIPSKGMVLNYRSSDDFFLAINKREVILNKKLIETLLKEKERGEVREERQLWDSDETKVPSLPEERRKELYLLTSRDGRRNYIRATCCKPIFGEEVDGIINEKAQVVVHKKSCPTAMRLKATHGDRLVPISWGPHVHSNFGVTLEIEGVNMDGFVFNIITTIKDARIPLTEISFSTAKDRAIGRVKIRIPNLSELDYIIRKLRDKNDLIKIHQVVE
ncbi:RelA/SpoT family protein [Porphyromonadaceae bacterium W3.11]|nr:RelA/SpoT family protein [Porphyromonadaceae bacterium W3.11]